jgi:transposase-like protein
MSKKRYTPEQIISILRKAEVELAQSQKTIAVVCRGLEITEQTYYRWRKLYGGMKVSQARRLKELEKENSRLKQAVADLTIDKLILKEALEGNY